MKSDMRCPAHYKLPGSWTDSPSDKRKAERENREPLKRAIQKLLDKPLKRKLTAKERLELAERVRSGRRQMSRMGLGL